MRISNAIADLDGILQAAVVMATATNKVLLENLDLLIEEAEAASPNDLVIALDAKDDASIDAALLEVDRLLTARDERAEGEVFPKTLNSAIRAMPDANLVMISVPGHFAAREAKKALKRGLNVFMFSSNVSIEDEVELKQLALEKGLLMMGPDCGTAIINNIILGFGNAVNPGTIGIVAAAGTGLQQVSTIIHSEGHGVSQAIGIGGNDLSKEVGGIMMLEGLRRLEQDDSTKGIVLVSKPPNQVVSDKVLAAASQSSKPIVVNFLGGNLDEIKSKGCVGAATLEDTAKAICAIMKNKEPLPIIFDADHGDVVSLAKKEYSNFSNEQQYVRGLYTGGTLYYEAMLLLTPLLSDLYSNAPLTSKQKLEDANVSVGNTCVDLGSEELTMGRPHPMIDYRLRSQRIVQEGVISETAVILLDVVLGLGSHDDPASELIPAITEAKNEAKKNGRYLSVIASIVGTSLDHQDLQKQRDALEDAGVIVMPSNAQAVRLAALIATKGSAQDMLFEEGL